jgi:hypothetical protein
MGEGTGPWRAGLYTTKLDQGARRSEKISRRSALNGRAIATMPIWRDLESQLEHVVSWEKTDDGHKAGYGVMPCTARLSITPKNLQIRKSVCQENHHGVRRRFRLEAP